MAVKRAILFILCILSAALCGCADDAAGMQDGYVTRSRQVFGDGIVFTASVRGGDEEGALAAMATLVDGIDAEMSLSRADSALSRFNAAGEGIQPYDGYESERIQVSRATYKLTQKAIAYHADTNGAFNIAVYPLARLWHVDTDGLNRYGFCDPSETPPPPTAQEVETALAACDISHLHTAQDENGYYLYKTDPRLQIDLGAVAKGYAADECIRLAKQYGVRSALINLSGNISLLGEWYRPEKNAYTRWSVGVLSPRPRKGLGGNVCALSVPADKTLVTSGDYERYYETLSLGKPLTVPHIVSGVTGLPLGVRAAEGGYENETDHIVSATVICEDSAMADAYATAVCLMGKTQGAAFLQARRLGGVLITEDNKMCLVGVTEQSEAGEVYFTFKNEYAAYARYEIEEVSF